MSNTEIKSCQLWKWNYVNCGNENASSTEIKLMKLLENSTIIANFAA